MTKDEALTLDALKYAASKGYGVAPFVAPFTIKRDKALAQPEQEPHNFCPRCGKRTPDPTTIHTCTPPRGLEMT
jgi:hypothetical protein